MVDKSLGLDYREDGELGLGGDLKIEGVLEVAC